MLLSLSLSSALSVSETAALVLNEFYSKRVIKVTYNNIHSEFCLVLYESPLHIIAVVLSNKTMYFLNIGIIEK